MWTTWLQRLGITFSISLLMACGGGGDDPEPNVVEVAQRDANFSILAEAVVAADLADKPLLTKVLTYHVLAGRVPKADVPAGPALTTVQGNTFTVDAAWPSTTAAAARPPSRPPMCWRATASST